ncbi:2-dehydro-3-deoxygluconokinase [Microbacterium phyllosphaerae]|uniref:2-dehydro-3-deoxygluconokinase n=1 Tax=Microbacterium phyllosphaerae TaxID=124798 RepID=A0ABS4WNP2_9MICO|nr:sugar kinase [Microbacterium phyllosphaerae]MBP2377826.1 2-dehydro-3-deoxygluconokinase [Microbacterium phyllosphaerae]
MSAPRVVTLGEALGLFSTAGPDGLDRAEHARIATGGAEANVAIGLARLGIDVAWLGRVGEDELGRRIVRELRAEGVHTAAIQDAAAPTALMLKDSSRPGRTTVRFYREGSAGSRLEVADVSRLDISSASWLHITGIALGISGSARDAILHAVQVAVENDVSISFDVNHRASLWGYSDAAPWYRRVAATASVVFGGDDELRAMVTAPDDSTPHQLAAQIAAQGPGEVVVKLGDRGAGVLADGAWLERPAQPARVIDTVGAGDAFVAGYISARLNHATVSEALDRALKTGAAACQHPGDWEGALRMHDLHAADDTLRVDPVQR